MNNEKTTQRTSILCIVTDIDECVENGWRLCYGECRNTIGGYECYCGVGMMLESDGIMCTGGSGEVTGGTWNGR